VSNPNIQLGMPVTVKVVIGLVVVSLAGLGVYVVYKKQHKDEPQRLERSFLDGGLPSSFLTRRPPVAPKVVEPEPAPEPVQETKPEPQVKIVVKYVTRPAAPEPVIIEPVIEYEAEALKAKIAALNEARKGASKGFTRAAAEAPAPGEPAWISTDKDYTEQGLAKRETSLPVDRSRVVTADKNISAILVEEINSELPGKIRAQIDMNVYGSVGRKVLIPSGSIAVGQYVPLGKVGDTRLRAVWTRILTPKGVNIVLSGAEMADAMGRAGLGGEVDTRTFERYGSAMLVSAIAVAAQWSVPAANQNAVNAVNTAGTELSRASRMVLEQNIDLKPKVIIKAGAMIQITPTEDIWFKAPRRAGGDITAEKIKRGKR